MDEDGYWFRAGVQMREERSEDTASKIVTFVIGLETYA